MLSISIVAGANATFPATAAVPPSLLLNGSVSGPGFLPLAKSVVFVTINDMDEHRGEAHVEHTSIAQAWVAPTGSFMLSVPTTTALVRYAKTHRGWANLYVSLLSSSGANAIVNAPIKQTAQGGFAMTNIDPTLPTTINIKLPASALRHSINVAAVPATSAIPSPIPSIMASLVGPNNAAMTMVNRALECPPDVGPCDPHPGICDDPHSCLPPICLASDTVATANDVPTTVGEVHSSVSYDPSFINPDGSRGEWHKEVATIEYDRGAHSQIDVGYSADGSHWSLSSSESFINASSNGISQSTDDLISQGFEFMPEFSYTEFHNTVKNNPECAFPPALGSPDLGYTTQATGCCGGWEIGIDKSFLDGPQQYANHKTLAFRGWDNGHNYKLSGTTARYQFAASVFGFNIGTMTDYDQDMRITWDFNYPYNGGPARPLYWLWGTNNEPNMENAQNVAAYTLVNVSDTGAATSVPTPDCYGDICLR